eukprot:CAMPEP_0113300092 /NCGR_PEP_ID=MMETSP0010_2-20120614/1862_1 /TAXON_ID=216773 ORGANISM="Corethron hystrix, Strain 308" /NCGR_SAMPLE_ID=MMETSP0010_2 /ASSEMBLY_ACC=CAM_ASM_000155 /LENGTH=771 /DNA_ID=CAMNT_0000153451 /DNA_START=305 /DNA_END=2617 /DNA_ORIENTATION=+ /assembly_acc=CAM_ASM_000155
MTMRDEFGRVVPGSQQHASYRSSSRGGGGSGRLPSGPGGLMDGPLSSDRGASGRVGSGGGRPRSSSAISRRDRKDSDDGGARGGRKSRAAENLPPTYRAWEDVRTSPSGLPEEWTRYLPRPLACRRLHLRDGGGEDYANYVRSYCTELSQGFFNAHLDDEWFRLLYSPAYRRASVLQNRERKRGEGAVLRAELQRDSEGFLAECRLGIGRPLGSKKGKRGAAGDDGDDGHNDSGGHGGRRRTGGAVPRTHLLSGHGGNVLRISQVPEWATDGHVAAALAEFGGKTSAAAQSQSGGSGQGPMRVCRAPVGRDNGGTLGSEDLNVKEGVNSLVRTCWAIFPSEDSKDETLDNLSKANFESTRHRHPDSSLELDVDCSDSFGRTEVDADGRGGAPPDNSAVPTRRCTVLVGAERSIVPIVLSAAVSVAARVQKDLSSARVIGKFLDASGNMPTGLRLEDLLREAFQDEDSYSNKDSSAPSKEEDMLDVCIAYLRRVHLFIFYTGQMANTEGELTAGLPGGTMHLRLRDADTILKETTEDRGISSETSDRTSDLLVNRLDTAIDNAIEYCKNKAQSDGIVVNAETDMKALEIEKEDDSEKRNWLDNHTLLDADGRARCSFHFCRKLFKDKTFLHKHLVKKHPEFLIAEQAKCHDRYMMEAWESSTRRPLPQIAIDCGHYGLHACTIKGKVPSVEDPEPVLREREEERYKAQKEEAAKAEEERLARERREYHDNAEDGEGLHKRPQQNHNSNFVDVDDVKDEKVKVMFEVVEFPSK